MGPETGPPLASWLCCPWILESGAGTVSVMSSRFELRVEETVVPAQAICPVPGCTGNRKAVSGWRDYLIVPTVGTFPNTGSKEHPTKVLKLSNDWVRGSWSDHPAGDPPRRPICT